MIEQTQVHVMEGRWGASVWGAGDEALTPNAVRRVRPNGQLIANEKIEDGRRNRGERGNAVEPEGLRHA